MLDSTRQHPNSIALYLFKPVGVNRFPCHHQTGIQEYGFWNAFSASLSLALPFLAIAAIKEEYGGGCVRS
jgi:hypothetical protein